MKKIQFDNNKNIISEKLRLLRRRQKLTQGELAAKMQVLGVNLDQQAISRIEKNARIVTDYELACFSIALSVEPGDLLADFHSASPGDEA